MRTLSIAALLAAAACGDDLDPLPDDQAPTTTAAPVGGIYRQAPEVTLTADEPALIYYTLDGSTPDTDSESGQSPLTIDSGLEAGAVVRFFAVDEAGNQESPKETEYVVDRLGPAAVERFAVAVTDDESAVTWSNPASPGFTTVVVARSEDVPATRAEDGESYEVGDAVGAGEVVFVGTGEALAEADLAPGGVAYVAWALYDTGVYSEPRAESDAVPLAAQDGQLTVDVAAGTVTVSTAVSHFDVSGANVSFDVGVTSFDVTVTPDGPNLLNNVKFVVTGIGGLVGSPDMTNADGTIADGGDHDGQQFRYFGPAAMVDGAAVTRTLSFDATLVNSVFTVDFAIVRHRGVIVTTWGGNDASGGTMHDLGSGLDQATLPPPASFDGMRVDDFSGLRGEILSTDGHTMYAGARNMPRVAKIDLVTMEEVGGIDLTTERGQGSVPYMFANQAGTRLYAVLHDGMHTYSGFGSHEEFVTRMSTRRPSPPTANTVFLVEIDPASMAEVGRLQLGEGDLTFSGRRGAVSRDDRTAAVVAGSNFLRDGADMPVSSTGVYLVDLSSFTMIDADADQEGDQRVDLTGVASPSVASFSDDGRRVVTNSNKNSAAGTLGAVIDLDDFTATSLAKPEGVTEPARALLPLSDGRVLLVGNFAGMLVVDPAVGAAAPFGGDFAGVESHAIGWASPGVIAVQAFQGLALIDADTGDVLQSATLPENFAHNLTLTIH